MVMPLRNLTRVGADMRQIASLLQAQGRNGDTMLAHINPREAALLRARGGVGTPNPATGLPQFYDASMDAESMPLEMSPTDTPYQESGDAAPQQFDYEQFSQQQPAEERVAPSLPPSVGFEAPAVAQPTPTSFAQQARPAELYSNEGYTGSVAGAGAPTPEAAPAAGMSQQMKERLGLAGIQALGTGLLAGRAGQQQRAATQEISKLGAPYRAKGAELMGLAQQGQLTAATQQQLDAVRAQLAQRAAGRGGVGANQIAQQTEAFRQQLLQQQYDLGLKLSGISDQYALQAIKAGMSADQAVNQMLGSAMTNIGRIFAGQPAPQTPTPPGGG